MPAFSRNRTIVYLTPIFALLFGTGTLSAASSPPAGPAYAETISPRRLLEVADLSNLIISPDGRSVAFRLEQASVERNVYDTVWYVQGLDGTLSPRRVADGGVTLRDSAGVTAPAPAVWSPDGRWIYYRAFLDDKIAVWRAAADGSGAAAVTTDPADVRDFSLATDGKTLRYSVGATREEVASAERSEYDRGIRIDGTVPIGQPLFRSGDIEGRWATQRFSMWFDRAPLLATVPDRWKAIDLMTLQIRDLPLSDRPPLPLAVSDLPKTLPEPSKLASNIEDGRIALLTRVGERPGFQDKPDVELAMLPSKDSTRAIKCLAELCTKKAISGIQWRPHSDEVIFTVTDPHEGLAQSIFRWNVQTGIVEPVTLSRGLINGGRDQNSACGLSTAVLVCVTAEADRPPRLERIDLASGQHTVLFDPNAALASDMAATAPAKLLRWTDAQGQEFTGQFFQARKADAAGPPPLFVTYYTCTGFLRGNVGDEWPLASMAEDGISALCINHPPGYILDAVKRYDQGLSGVESAVALLASKGEIDRTKVGMGGLSFGSEVTMWTVMHSKLLAAASVTSPSMARSYYLFSNLRDDSIYAVLKKNWQLGAPEETPERWHILAPEFNLEKIKAPILLQMPEQEYIWVLDYTMPLMRAGKADLYVFPNEPHQKFQPKHKLAAYERNLDWFRFWLQGYERPDPQDLNQYKRWEHLRDTQSTGSAQR